MGTDDQDSAMINDDIDDDAGMYVWPTPHRHANYSPVAEMLG